VNTTETQNNVTSEQVLPAVNFDVGSSKKSTNVDFDYANYDKYLRANGLYGDDIGDTSIRFHAPKLFPFNPGKHNTQYIEGRAHGEIDVYAVGKKANKVLVHETQHRIDRMNGFIATHQPRRNLAEKGLLVGLSGVFGGLTSEVAIPTHAPSEFFIGSIAMLGVGLAGFLSGAAGYKLRPIERRARRAAREVKTQFVTFSKKA